MNDLFTCPCCSSTHFSPSFLRSDSINHTIFAYRTCNKCKLTCSNPIPTETQLKEVYSNYFNYNWYKKVALFKKIQAYKRTKLSISHLPKKGTLLDIGSGHGYFIDMMRKHGYDSSGYEPSDSSIISYQNNTYRGTSIGSIEKRFDLITMWHSLEHVQNPILMLEEISILLKPDGKLIIAVPNFNSIGQDKQKGNWVWLQQPFIHIWHFNPSNLTQLLKKTNFNVVKTITKDTWDAQIYDYSSLPYISRIINRLFFKKIDYDLLEAYVRVLTLPMSQLMNLTWFKYTKKGSELLIIASHDKK